MPVIYEKNQSRSFTTDAKMASLEREYHIQGTNDEAEAYELLVLTAPILYAGLVRKTVKAESHGGGLWTGTVSYDSSVSEQQALSQTDPETPTAEPAPGDLLGPAYSFNTTGGTAHINQSKGTRSVTTADGSGDDTGDVGNKFTLNNKRAIGLTSDGVNGTDIYVPSFEFSIEVLRANCTRGYLNTLMELTGTVNYNAPFMTYPVGTILYLGASGQYTANNRWSITHKFAYRKNEFDLDISEDITVPVKRGWDYLWVAYGTDAIMALGMVVKTPMAAYVERVYDTGDFSLLEIGG